MASSKQLQYGGHGQPGIGAADRVDGFSPLVHSADERYIITWGDTVLVTPSGGQRLGRAPHGIAIAS